MKTVIYELLPALLIPRLKEFLHLEMSKIMFIGKQLQLPVPDVWLQYTLIVGLLNILDKKLFTVFNSKYKKILLKII